MNNLVEILSGVTASVVAGLLTVFAALASSWLNRKKQDSEQAQRADIEELTRLASSRREEAQSRAVAVLAEKLPIGLSAEELQKAIGSQIRIGNLVVNQTPPEERELVEDLVGSYHQQALSQARVQFWFSVGAATVGFGYILYAASHIQGPSVIEYVKILPGIVIDAVAALFFKQAEQTRERATELYDRLRQDRQAQRAEAMVASIEDTTIRSAVKAQIALHMAGLAPKEIDLPTFLTKTGKDLKAQQEAGPYGPPPAGSPSGQP